jgi:hypothetical protein
LKNVTKMENQGIEASFVIPGLASVGRLDEPCQLLAEAALRRLVPYA